MERECRYRKSQESVRVECGVWSSAHQNAAWSKVWVVARERERERGGGGGGDAVDPSKVKYP
jgi:hypothetical protein